MLNDFLLRLAQPCMIEGAPAAHRRFEPWRHPVWRGVLKLLKHVTHTPNAATAATAAATTSPAADPVAAAPQYAAVSVAMSTAAICFLPLRSSGHHTQLGGTMRVVDAILLGPAKD